MGDALCHGGAAVDGLGECGVDREHEVGLGGGEVLARGGDAGLHQDRVALRRAGDVERAADVEVLAMVVKGVDAGGVGEHAGGLVRVDGAVFPGVPKAAQHVHELCSPAVAGVVLHRGTRAEVGCLLPGGGSNDVDPGPALAQVVEGGELAGCGVQVRCRRWRRWR